MSRMRVPRPAVGIDASFVAELAGGLVAHAVQVGQRDDRRLVVRDVDTQ